MCSLLGLGEVALVDDHAIFENASSSYAMGDQDIYITEVGNGTLITTAVYINVADVGPVTENGGKAMRFLLGDATGLYNFFLQRMEKAKDHLISGKA